jgi:hypothetical protein
MPPLNCNHLHLLAPSGCESQVKKVDDRIARAMNVVKPQTTE